MPLDFTPATYARMVALEVKLTEVLERANRDDRMEAGIAAFALIRRARVLLDKYPPTARTALVDVCCAFLQRAVEVDGTGQIIKLH